MGVNLAVTQMPSVADDPFTRPGGKDRLEEDRILRLGEVVQLLNIDRTLPVDIRSEEFFQRLVSTDDVRWRNREHIKGRNQ